MAPYELGGAVPASSEAEADAALPPPPTAEADAVLPPPPTGEGDAALPPPPSEANPLPASPPKEEAGSAPPDAAGPELPELPDDPVAAALPLPPPPGAAADPVAASAPEPVTMADIAGWSTTDVGCHVAVDTMGEGKTRRLVRPARRVRSPRWPAGVLAFVGHHHETNKPRLGVTLDTAAGKNNGIVKGRLYFNCPDNHGVLTPAKFVQRLQTTDLYGSSDGSDMD